MKRMGLILVAVLLHGCANIPIATMLKFSGFDATSLAAIDGHQIRAKVTVTEPHTLNLEQTQLAMELETAKGFRRFTFPLQLISKTTVPAEHGLFSSSAAKTQYLLKVSDAGLKSFAEIQQLLVDKPERKGSLTVGAGFNNTLNGEASPRMSIDLQLTQDEGFFTLIEDAELEIK